MNKKGVMDDMILFMGLIVLAGISLIIVYIILDGVNTGVQQNDQMTPEIKNFTSTYTSDYATTFDYTFLTLFVAGVIGLLIITFVLSSNPGLFFALWFILVIITIVAAALSNGLEEAFDDSNLSAASSQFPITTHILENLVLYMMGANFLMLLVFFAKPGGGP